MNFFILGIITYLLGSIPFSYIIPKVLTKEDIRQHGSGNTGTTNVVRTLGLKVGVLAFIGDFLKGSLAAYIGLHFMGEQGAIVACAMVIIGHCYPVWLKFKGGKGIATTGGLLLVIMPKVLVAVLIIQFFVLFATKYMSLGSISSCIALPILTYAFGYFDQYFYLALPLGLFLLFKHRSNISRLFKGEEKKLTIGSRKKSA